MKKGLSMLALALPALLLLGGCAIEPSYRYSANAGAGYYYGQSPYGNADTVVTGGFYGDPWGFGYSPWGFGYGPWGYFGGSYRLYPGWGFAPWFGFGGYFRANGYRYYRHDPRYPGVHPTNWRPPVRIMREHASQGVSPVEHGRGIPRQAPIGVTHYYREPASFWRAPVRSAPVERPTRVTSRTTRRVR